jgi:hypothetical protein
MFRIEFRSYVDGPCVEIRQTNWERNPSPNREQRT